VRRILIVDDESSVRLVLSHCMELMKFSVKTAASGVEALKLVEEETFDAVIMDINMPTMTGVETCRRMQSGLSDQCPPIWLMTGMWSGDIEEVGVAAGARAVLAKPFKYEELVKKLKADWERAA
jgi:two-component system response regulator PrrA